MMQDTDTALKVAAASAAAESRQALVFHMLNRTPAAVPYDRSSFWRLGRKAALLGVSGMAAPDPRGPFATAWRKALSKSRLGDKPGRLSVADLAPGMDALLLPLSGTGTALAFERWETPFSELEITILTDLAAVYAMAWNACGKKERPYSGLVRAALVVAALVASLLLVRLPLRVAAYCEVVPGAPFLVATPVDGVLREVTVESGQMVRAGDVLAVYEESVPEGELEVARRQVEAAAAELLTLRTRSLENPLLRGEAAVLEARLEQERARLAAVEERWSKVRIVAPMDGMVRMDDPSLWRGRPVAIGERLLWLVRPEDNHPRIWLPQSDRVEFDPDRPIRIHLEAYGGDLLSARLVRVGTLVRQSPQREFAFPAEAEWLDVPDPSPYMGLSGMAILYGPEVPLGYWLVRKPLAGLRKWLGL